MVEKRIKAIIREKGLIQKHVASVAGYSEKEFSRFLNGGKVIRDSDVWKISQALGVRPDELYGIEK